MASDLDSIRSRFAELDQRGQLFVLIAASFNLTIEFRGLRDAPDTMTRTLANGMNELQHKLLAQALSKLSGTVGYPDDVLLGIAFEVATANGVVESAVASLSDALDRFERGG